MSRSIKSLKKLKSMVGKEVKVCTVDDIVGICLVAEDKAGDTCLISKDKALLEAEYFWEIESSERAYIKNCTAEYVAGHYCWKEKQLIEELEWVTSSVPRKKPTKKTKAKPTVTVKAKPAKETKETRDDAFRPLNIAQLKEHMPCNVLLKDDQVAFVELDCGVPTVYFNTPVDKVYGWYTDREDYKVGWHINDEEDFEAVFEVSEGKLAQSTEPVESSQHEVAKEILETLQDIKKDILETLKEIKNEIVKR